MESIPTSSPDTAATARRCENCGSPLLGEHCYACGQPTKGLVRHFSSIIGDFFDSVFNFDTRTLRTLGPLLLRPGFLSLEYFAGHRVRFVSPVRLFFFLCIAAFLALQFSVDLDFGVDTQSSEIARAETVADVEKLRDNVVQQLTEAREQIPDTPGARVGMDVGIENVRAQAQRRIEWLTARDAAVARGEEPPPFGSSGINVRVAGARVAGEGAEEDGGETGIQFNDRPWHPDTNPVAIDWAPARVNLWLNQLVGRAQGNVERIRAEPRLLFEAFMEALPQTLFVLLPLFALLLKLAYVFKRRLYMEHLIVALHSHAFLCAAVLILVGLGAVRDLLGSGVVHAALGWTEVVVAVWMPLYLLLMQKRVYRQGWIMTLLKFCMLGTCYLVLLSLGGALNLVVSLVAM